MIHGESSRNIWMMLRRSSSPRPVSIDRPPEEDGIWGLPPGPDMTYKVIMFSPHRTSLHQHTSSLLPIYLHSCNYRYASVLAYAVIDYNLIKARLCWITIKTLTVKTTNFLFFSRPSPLLPQPLLRGLLKTPRTRKYSPNSPKIHQPCRRPISSL